MKSAQTSKSSRTFYSGVSTEDYEHLDVYSLSKRKSAEKEVNIENICFYKQLNIIIEALMDGGWVTVDWITDCSATQIEDALSNHKELNSRVIYRAINRTTGRMMDFA